MMKMRSHAIRLNCLLLLMAIQEGLAGSLLKLRQNHDNNIQSADTKFQGVSRIKGTRTQPNNENNSYSPPAKFQGGSRIKGRRTQQQVSIYEQQDDSDRRNSHSFDEMENIFKNYGEIDTEDDFLHFCQTQLLSAEYSMDGLISQHDVADFIETVCDAMDDEDLPDFNCPRPQFNDLAMDVQVAFVWFICEDIEDEDALLDCLLTYLSTPYEFGYISSPAFLPRAWTDVFGFCCALLPFLEKTNIKPLAADRACPEILPQLPHVQSLPPIPSPAYHSSPAVSPSFPSSNSWPTVPGEPTSPATSPSLPSSNLWPTVPGGPPASEDYPDSSPSHGQPSSQDQPIYRPPTPIMPVPTTPSFPGPFRTPRPTVSPKRGPTRSPAPTITASPTSTAYPTVSPTITPPTRSPVPTRTASPTITASPTASPTMSASPTMTASPTANLIPPSIPSSTFTWNPTPGQEPSFTSQPTPERDPIPADSNGLSAGAVAGIVIGGAAVFLLCGFFATRRLGRED